MSTSKIIETTGAAPGREKLAEALFDLPVIDPKVETCDAPLL
jgi:hypothetical protein